MATIGTIAVDILLTGLGPANRSLDDLKGKSKGASDGLDSVKKKSEEASNAAKKLEKDVGGLSGALGVVKSAALGLFAAFSVQKISQIADSWSDMQSRIGAAAKNMEAAPALMQRMVDLANASYSPLEQTVDVYARNVGVLRDLGVSAAGAADFTESLNHMLVITATRGERAASVQNALSKAMAVGKLQADGLETVLANGGRVAEALAAELGTTVSGLRGMASQGKITGDVIKNALLNSLEDVREEAAEMPATIADAFTRIATNTTSLIGVLDQAWGVSGRVSEQLLAMADGIRASSDTILRLGNIVGSVLGPAFGLLSENVENITSVAGVAVAALAGFYAPAVIAGLWSLSTALVTGVAGGIRAITLAMMANPIGLLIGGLAAAVTAAFMFRDKIKQVIGVDVIEVFKTGANTIIGAMVGAVEATKTAWEVLPDFMSGVGARAWNAFLSGFEGPAVSWTNPFTGEKFDLINLDLSAFKADEGGAGGAAVGAVTKAFSDAQGHDYVGDISASIGELWENAGGASGAISELANQLGGGGGGATDPAGGGLSKASKKAKEDIDKVSEAMKKAQETGKQMGQAVVDSLKELFKSVFTGGKDALEIVGSLLNKLGDLALDAAFNLLSAGLFGGAGGGGNLFSWIGGLFGFAQGGYTGNSATNKVAGVVHGGEYVFSASATSRIGVANLEKMHSAAKGYAGGGFVGSAPAFASGAANDVNIKVDVGVSVNDNGELQAYVINVSRSESATAASTAGQAAVRQANKSAPGAIARFQSEQAGSDYRL